MIHKLLMMNGVSVQNMYRANFRINTYGKVHLVGLFIQLIMMHGLYNIKLCTVIYMVKYSVSSIDFNMNL